jgi:hypothetical protein
MTTKKKKEKKEGWRNLCELITHESDPQRLSELADQLLKELDAREPTVSKTKNNNNDRRKPASPTARKSRN